MRIKTLDIMKKNFIVIVFAIITGMTCWAEEIKSLETSSISINMEDKSFTYLKDVYLYDQNGNYYTIASVYEIIIGGKRQIYISTVRGAEKYRAENVVRNSSFNYRVLLKLNSNTSVYFYFKL